MQIPKWRNVLVLRNSLISSTYSGTRLASFHSTSALCEKRKDKWNFDVRGSEQPSKNFIRYATRHKRADAKKALKNLLFISGYSPKVSYQHIQAEDNSSSSPKNARSKSCRHAQKSHYKKMKRKLKRESFSDDENHPETIFQGTYGKRWYTWSFNSQRNFFQDSESAFEWREASRFHLSALKWHPDKHQGSSQEMAAEKFRLCVNAYNSLCSALSAT